MSKSVFLFLDANPEFVFSKFYGAFIIIKTRAFKL